MLIESNEGNFLELIYDKPSRIWFNKLCLFHCVEFSSYANILSSKRLGMICMDLFYFSRI